MHLDRLPAVAAQIAALPDPGTTERDAYVTAHAQELRPETLVFLLRESALGAQTAKFEQLALALVGHPDGVGGLVGGFCEPVIRSTARRFGFGADPEVFRDFRQHCHAGLWKAILAGTQKKPHWEERFLHALKALCIDEARALSRRLHELEWAEEREDVDGAADGTAAETPPLDDAVLDRIVEQEFAAAILRLPPRQARAAFLAWIERRKVESTDARSISSIMQVSARAVYALLEKAKATLAADPQIRKYLTER